VYQHPGAPTIYYVPKVMTQAIVLAVMPRPPLDPAQLPLSQLLGRYVGGGMDGLVFQELREARGLAYSASAWHSAGRRPADESALVGFVGTQADKTGEALPALLGLLRGMKVDPHRFAKARQALLETLRTERTEPRAVADMVRSWEELGFPADPRPGWLDAIGALDREALQRFAAQFAGGDLVIGVVGDREHIDLPALGKLARLVDRTPAQLFGF
jgi:predicted Zn-dependent peptidase